MKRMLLFLLFAVALLGVLFPTAAMAYDDLITNDTTAGETAGSLSGSVGLLYLTASKGWDTNTKTVDFAENVTMFRVPLKASYGVTDKLTLFAIVPLVRLDPGVGDPKTGVGDAWLGAKYGILPDGLLTIRGALDIPSGPDKDMLGNPGGYGVEVGVLGLMKVDQMEMNGQVGIRKNAEGRENSWAPGIGAVNKWAPGNGFYAAVQGSYDFVGAFKGIVGVEFLSVANGFADGVKVRKSSMNYVDLNGGLAYQLGETISLRGDVIYTASGENNFQYFGGRV
ncbi:MAG: hypothetical protein ACYC9O_16580, partial [Candidatus Latescibacterota bacterium]